MREAEDKQKQVLLDIKTVAERLQLPILFVGAGARIFAFDKQYNIEGRTTKDLDFAVQVNNWSNYQSLSEEMTLSENPRFAKTYIQHKFVHISTGIEVDIVPFGEIAQPSKLLKWSDGNEMNLLGLDEAFLTAIILIIDEIEIKVVDPRALLVLKLIAWADRKAMKDLQDIYFILANFNDDDRIFEELLDELSEGLIEYEDAATFLLGRDIRRMFSKATINEIQKILPQLLQNRDKLFPRLISNTFVAEDWDAKFDTICRLFRLWSKEYMVILYKFYKIPNDVETRVQSRLFLNIMAGELRRIKVELERVQSRLFLNIIAGILARSTTPQ